MCKTILGPDKPQITIRHRCIAYWIPKAMNAHSEYLILIAFQLQQWLHKCALTFIPWRSLQETVW